MPCDYKNYPANWKTEIRPAILKRANDKCEFCSAVNYEPHPETGSKVILTIAHLDQDIANNHFDNLKALCQKCHLQHDGKQHARTADRNKRLALEENGQQLLPLSPNPPETKNNKT